MPRYLTDRFRVDIVRASLRPAWQRWWPAVVGACVYTLLCMAKAGPLGLLQGAPWHDWWDQGQYLKSAFAFGRGDLSPAQHWYPLLYPLLAVPFTPVFSQNPFLPLDVLCAGWIAHSVSRVAQHLGIRRGVSLCILLATLAWPPQLWVAWVAPWTTTVSAALIWWLMARIGDIALDRKLLSRSASIAIGVAGAMIPLARPADAPIALLFGMSVLYFLFRRRDFRASAALTMIASSLVTVGVYAALYLSIYGPRQTEYTILSQTYGLYFGNLGWKAAVLLIDSRPWFGTTNPELDLSLLDRMPWVLLGVAGAVFLSLRRDGGEERAYIMVMLFAITVSIIMMMAYIDLLPTGLWRYSNVHYFKWIFPLFGLFAWKLARDRRRFFPLAALCLTGSIALSGFRVVAVPALPAETARRVDFPAPRGADWDGIYFSRSVITDRGRTYRNLFDYHQTLVGRRVRAISLREGFPSGAEWHPSGANTVSWPVGASTHVSAPAPPVSELARWKARLVWNVPCWISGCESDAS